MTKRDIVILYEEAVKDVVKNMAEIFKSRKFRRSNGNSGYPEDKIHKYALEHLLDNADKETTLKIIQGIANGKFANTADERSVEGFVLKDIIRDNIHDKDITAKSLEAMEEMINSTRKSLKGTDKEKAVADVNSMQNMLYAIADLREDFPTSLGKQTDHIYDVYKLMMKEYSLSGLHNDGINHTLSEIEDYFYGRDAYNDVKEADIIRKQENAAWETKEQIEASKQRIYNKFTKREVADYEQRHADEVKKEDLQDKIERDNVIANHENHIRSKEHRKQITEENLRRNEERLSKAYENFKDIARKPKEGDEKKDNPISNDVPKRAVFIGRAEPRQN
ncbi:MAG: hypothetical protein IJ532_01665 [Alphaproteobacteria bacterium]|nr:hypothetical protein [Alphaproteobacteria bacterium]